MDDADMTGTDERLAAIVRGENDPEFDPDSVQLSEEEARQPDHDHGETSHDREDDDDGR